MVSKCFKPCPKYVKVIGIGDHHPKYGWRMLNRNSVFKTTAKPLRRAGSPKFWVGFIFRHPCACSHQRKQTKNDLRKGMWCKVFLERISGKPDIQQWFPDVSWRISLQVALFNLLAPPATRVWSYEVRHHPSSPHQASIPLVKVPKHMQSVHLLPCSKVFGSISWKRISHLLFHDPIAMEFQNADIQTQAFMGWIQLVNIFNVFFVRI